MTDVIDLLRRALDERPDKIREALTLTPCHITGMHKPDHHLDYTCQDQEATALRRLLSAVGALTSDDLPHALHGPRCGWCTNVPSQEEFRARLRRTWEWAGVPLTPELAETAVDGWHPGDDEIVLAAMRAVQEASEDGWWFRTDVHDHLEAGGTPMPHVRIAIVERRLGDALAERVHEHRAQNRLVA